MSILNVNQIQPVGGGNTITVSANDVNFSGNISIGSSFVGTATTASLATSAQGLTGTPDITVGNIQSGVVTATTFIGDGSGLTGVTASGSGINIKDSGSTVGVAATVDFSTNLNVSPASAGIVTVTVGDTDFSIADKIVHTGDTNTAIRFPSDDTVTVETAGSEALRITSTGNVKIGSGTPGAKFHVEDANTTAYNAAATTAAASLYLVNTGSNSPLGIILQNQSTDNSNTCQSTISSVPEGTNKNTSLTFGTRQNSDATIRERLRITSSGNVGIGTDNPSAAYKLHVSDVGGTIALHNSAQSNTIRYANNNTTAEWSAGTSRPGLTNAGNYYSITQYGTDSTWRERFTIDSGGNVGINETSPDSKFHVNSGAETVPARFESTGTQSRIGFQASGTPTSYHVACGAEANDFIVYTNNTEKLRITSGGNIGIGTTNPDDKLHLQDGQLIIKGTGEGGPYLYRDGGNGSDIVFHASRGTFASPTASADTDLLGNINFAGYDGSSYLRRASINGVVDGAVSSNTVPTAIIFRTGTNATPTERLRVDSAGTIKCGTSSVLKAEINSAISGHQFISQCDDNNNGFEIYQQHGSTTTRNTFAVYANTGGGGAQELQFSVRGDGCVTKPTSPSFAARLGGSNIDISSSGNTDVVFSAEYFDNGNNYDTSNGRFTAPIAGKYFFGVQLYVGFSVTAVRVMHAKFNKNGSTYAQADLFGGTNADAGTHYHPTGCASMMIDLAANDYVTFNLGTLSVTGSGNTYLYASTGTRFFGYLVG